jgi:hypothetical protein
MDIHFVDREASYLIDEVEHAQLDGIGRRREGEFVLIPFPRRDRIREVYVIF